MKVSAGRYKGKSISVSCSTKIRPTTEKIKEWIFQIVEPNIPDSTVLDLFAGSGNLGIEALSRGSSFAVFVDKFTDHLIRRNINTLKPDSPVKVYREDVLRFLRRRFSKRFRFSIIIADPPYNFSSFHSFLLSIYESELLKPGGIFILESGKHSITDIPESFYPLIREKTFGETVIRIFQRGTL